VALTGLLRVAHAVARGPEGDGLDLSARVRDERVRIRVVGAVSPDAAVAEARLSAALLQRSIGLEVEVERAPARASGAPRAAGR
jgi:hypothetical protein